MPLDPGFRIGPYEIVRLLGAGGMGEVYRARDTRLKRDVALKFLPDTVRTDPERLARFEREAQALAALKHPHIASIYGIEEAQGLRALVLELAEGETLADRIGRGPLPVPEALAIARQIVDALEAAHEHAIVHRDLKPANIQIAPNGEVKVLDFGLARIVASDNSDAIRVDASVSPTITSPAIVTAHNVLLGTAAYMAPEQARGKPVDKRADIWAFGVVLYEMLTGSRAFAGDSIAEVAGAVIHKDLPLAALPPDTPETVRVALQRCLEKDPKQRMRDMGDVRLLLDGAFGALQSTASGDDAHRRLGFVAMALAGVVAAAISGALVWALMRTPPAERHPVRVSVPAPSAGLIQRAAIALSPNGRHLAFVAPDKGESRLWVHSFETGESHVVAPQDTVGFSALWSPDSESLAFLADGKLKRTTASGGAVQTIADLTSYSGGCWLSDDVIIIATGSGMLRIPAAGPATRVTTVNVERGETFHAAPVALPDRLHFLYLRGSKDPNVAGVYVGRADAAPENQEARRLMAGSLMPVYAADDGEADGHLLYTENGIMMSQRFDPRRIELVGNPIRVPGVERVHAVEAFAAVSASANGAIAYRGAASDFASLVFLTRDGKESASIAAHLEQAQNPRLSPDGRSLALIVARDLWKYDVGGRPPVKLTFDGALSPVWSPDGSKIVYEGGGTLRAISSDGSGKSEDVAPKGHFHPHAFTADSREMIAVQLVEGGTAFSLVRIGLQPGSNPQPISTGGLSAALSPDGRWLASTAETTGAREVWVRPFPGPGAPVRVSPNGGSEPVWAKNGRELFYLQESDMMAVAVDTASGFNFKPAVRLFETSHLRNNQPPSYDVTVDGRFVVLKPQTTADEPITVVFNWTTTQSSTRRVPVN
jgi:hypothetical protein